MFPFDVILFDVGGVLLTNGWDQRERAAVLENFGLDLAAFEARSRTVYDAWEPTWTRPSSTSRAVSPAMSFLLSCWLSPSLCPMGRWESSAKLRYPESA